MKNTIGLILVTGFAASFAVANNAGAEGVAASPKVQKMLNERPVCCVAAAPVSSVTYHTPGLQGITASPKLREMLAGRKVVVGPVPATEMASAGYTPTGPDGVTASPKLRSQLNANNAPIILAPLK